MNSLIARTAARGLVPLLLLFSIFLLLAGHDEPGGGFVGGLVAATAIVLHALTHDAGEARALVGADPRTIVAIGLLCALAAGVIGLAVDRPLLTGIWAEWRLGTLAVTVGTPLLFDTGVYLLVAGVTLLMVLGLEED